MQFRSIESQIVTLFLLLIIAVQLAGFFVIRDGIVNNEEASIRDQLSLGVPLFNRLLEQRAQILKVGARALAADFGFRKAISTDDKETIESALVNAGDRINASLTLFVGLDHHILVSTQAQVPDNLEKTIAQLIGRAEQEDGAVGISFFDNQAFQVLVVPVKAPITQGWIAMLFPLDEKLAKEMRELSSLDVSFLVAGGNGNWKSNVSTLPKAQAQTVAEQLQGATGTSGASMKLVLDGKNYSVRTFQLMGAGPNAIVVLQRSIDEAIAPYRQLQIKMSMITGVLIVCAFILCLFAAKRIGGPLRDLTETAKRLGDGDYQGQIVIDREDEIGKLSQAFKNMRDNISTRELEIKRLAYWDTLTNLPNRAQFSLLLDEAINHAIKQSAECFVLMMDLDRFKNVNDVLGHTFGDELLQQVALRLTQTVGKDYPVARLGGDEFAVLMPMTALEDAKAVASRILKTLETPISMDDQTVDLGAGIGIAGFPMHGSDAQSLLSRAEVAMYLAKIGGNEAVLYDPTLDKSSQNSLSLLSDLRRAIDNDEFKLFVQPKLMLDTGEFVGMEALVRWQHPKRGMIFPDHFIPFSEKTGFIRMLTRWILEKAAVLSHDLTLAGVNVKISVNLSARDLLDQNLPLKFAEVLSQYDVSASSFCLEITESSIMDDPLRAQVTLEGLHAMGVDLSIDDFGTGYSSLAYLKRLPVDELKIDKSFVMNMERDADDAKIVRSTIDLGHNMGLRVVAEGIESEAVWHLLAKMGCDQGQGYFMSRPIAASDLLDWIKKWTPPQPQTEELKSLPA